MLKIMCKFTLRSPRCWCNAWWGIFADGYSCRRITGTHKHNLTAVFWAFCLTAKQTVQDKPVCVCRCGWQIHFHILLCEQVQCQSSLFFFVFFLRLCRRGRSTQKVKYCVRDPDNSLLSVYKRTRWLEIHLLCHFNWKEGVKFVATR